MATMTIEQMRQTLNNATKAIFPDYEWRVTGKPDDPHLRFANKNGDMLLDPKIHDVLQKAFEDAGLNGPHNINDLVRPTSVHFNGNIPGRSFSLREHREIVSIFPRLARTDWIQPFAESLKQNVDQINLRKQTWDKAVDRQGNERHYARLDQMTEGQKNTLIDHLKKTGIKYEIKDTSMYNQGNRPTSMINAMLGGIDAADRVGGTPVISIDSKDFSRLEASLTQVKTTQLAAKSASQSPPRVPSNAAARIFGKPDPVDRALDLRAEKIAKDIKTEIGTLPQDAQEKVLQKLAQILGKGLMKVVPITALGIAAHERMGLEEASAALVREGVLTQDDADRYKTGVLEESVGLETVDPTVVIAEGVAHLRYRSWLGGLSPEKREAVGDKLAPPSVIRDGFAAIRDAVTGWAGPGDNTGAMSSYDGLVQTPSALDRNVSPEFKAAAVGKAGEGSAAPEIKPDAPKL